MEINSELLAFELSEELSFSARTTEQTGFNPWGCTGKNDGEQGFDFLRIGNPKGFSGQSNEGEGMRVFIQHTQSGLYLASETDWQPDERKARDFKSSLNAIDFCLAHKIRGVEIVLRFSEEKYNIRLRLFQNSAKAKQNLRGVKEGRNGKRKKILPSLLKKNGVKNPVKPLPNLWRPVV